jgi:hypothetical protein
MMKLMINHDMMIVMVLMLMMMLVVSSLVGGRKRGMMSERDERSEKSTICQTLAILLDEKVV